MLWPFNNVPSGWRSNTSVVPSVIEDIICPCVIPVAETIIPGVKLAVLLITMVVPELPVGL